MAPLGLAVATVIAPAARTGRDGLLRARLERRGERTVVTACRWTLPLQVLAPVALDDPAAVLSVLNPTGGLVGGDRLDIDIAVGPGAHGCITTPSATKVYRTRDEPAEQDVRLDVGAGATLEWVPDHTIPFAGSALRQRIAVHLGDGARLILVDAFAAGRIARGEAWQFRRLDSALSVRDEGGWIFCDRFALDGDRRWAALGLTEDRPYFATMLALGPGSVEPLRRAVADALVDAEGVTSGVGVLARGGVAVRVLAGRAPDLTDALDRLWAAARRALLGLSPLALRKN
jgi:urease accessory protein